MSAQPWPAPPASGVPWQPGQAWPPGQPKPPTPNRGLRAAAIAAGVALPLIVMIVVAALVIAPRLREAGPEATAGPSTSASSPASPSPSIDILAVPVVGTCYQPADSYGLNQEMRSDAEQDQPVPCDETHIMETVGAGTVDEATRPARSSDTARVLYAECAAAAEEYLGVHWRATQTWLVLSMPSSSAWNDGANWYRCDLAVNRGFDRSDGLDTTGSLRDTATPLGCLTWDVVDESLAGIELAECNTPHQGEVAGAFEAGDIDRTVEDDFLTEVDIRCEDVVLSFLGQGTLNADLSFWYWYPGSATTIDQNVICMVSAAEDARAVTGSLAGIGAGPIPFA